MENDQILNAVYQRDINQYNRRRQTSNAGNNDSSDGSIGKDESRLQSSSSNIWSHVNRRNLLPQLLTQQYGDETREIVKQDYGPGDRDSQRPHLIDDLLKEQRKQYEKQLKLHREEKERLLAERTALIRKQELRQHQIQRPFDQPITVREVNDGRYDNEVRSPENIEQFIQRTSETLPGQIQKHRQQRKLLQDNLQHPDRYRGEYGPQSYEAWQMTDYYMVRGIVDNLVDSVLDSFTRHLPPIVVNAKPKLPSDVKYHWMLEKTRKDKEHCMQLIAEELLLQTTSEMSGGIAQELMCICDLIKGRSDHMYMKTAEQVAIGGHGEERSVNDPAYTLVTKNYFEKQKVRNEFKHFVWNHSTRLQSVEPPANLPDPEIEEEPTVTKHPDLSDEGDVSLDADVYKLPIHWIVPAELYEFQETSRDTAISADNKQRYKNYVVLEHDYWKNMMTSIKQFGLSRSIVGVSCIEFSNNDQFMALGTVHGDLFVYDLTFTPWRLLKVLHNYNKQHHTIITIAWSLDNTKIITQNNKGTIYIWTCQSSASQVSDLKSLEVGSDSHGIVPTQLALLQMFHTADPEFVFQDGNLKDISAMDGHSNVTKCCFHPSMSLLGKQNSICVGLESGDILKLNLAYHETMKSDFTNIAQIYQPEIKSHHGDNYFPQGVTGELFRGHKQTIMILAFCNCTGDMISVDTKGYINLWSYTIKNTAANYGWFKPSKKHRLQMFKKIFHPTENTKINKIFDDATSTNIDVEREEAEYRLSRVELGEAWHEEFDVERGTVMRSFPLVKATNESKGEFHDITRYISTQILASYTAQQQTAVKIYATKILSCIISPLCDVMVFVLLFPEAYPQKEHLQIVALSLPALRVMDVKINISVLPQQYHRCLNEDVVSCQVSKSLASTGSRYVFLMVLGQLSVFSLSTGRQVVVTVNNRIKSPVQAKCQLDIQQYAFTEHSRIKVNAVHSKIYVVQYNAQNRRERDGGIIKVMTFEDKSSEEERIEMLETYKQWYFHPQKVPQEQRINLTESLLGAPLQEDYIHPAVFVERELLNHLNTELDRREGRRVTAKQNQERMQETVDDAYRKLHAKVTGIDIKKKWQGAINKLKNLKAFKR